MCLDPTRSNGFGIEQSGDCVNELVIGNSVDRDYEEYTEYDKKWTHESV